MGQMGGTEVISGGAASLVSRGRWEDDRCRSDSSLRKRSSGGRGARAMSSRCRAEDMSEAMVGAEAEARIRTW